MERDDREALICFLVGEEEFVPGATVALGAAILNHLKVRRLSVGARLALLDGRGHRAVGNLLRVQPGAAVEIVSVSVTPPPPAVHLLVPIADRDRMLWLAEKCGELGVTSWRPVLYRRSRGVKPRGEGPMFAARVRSRMAAALEQSGGTWMPTLFPESTVVRAIGSLPRGGSRLALDPHAAPATTEPLTAPVALAVGPEGGLEGDELEQLEAAGFRRVRLGGNILRFETAAVAAVSLARTVLLPPA